MVENKKKPMDTIKRLLYYESLNLNRQTKNQRNISATYKSIQKIETVCYKNKIIASACIFYIT